MDIERAMQFIVEHQVKLAASVENHDEQIGRLGASVATLTDLVGRPAQAEIRLVETMNGQEARLQALESKATQLFERMDRFIQRLESDGHKPR